jgi:hypothetical protein
VGQPVAASAAGLAPLLPSLCEQGPTLRGAGHRQRQYRFWAQPGNALLAPQPGNHDPDLVLGTKNADGLPS